MNDRGGFPWLSASALPELILFAPQRQGSAVEGDLPTHVRTPDGEEMAVFGQELGLSTDEIDTLREQGVL